MKMLTANMKLVVSCFFSLNSCLLVTDFCQLFTLGDVSSVKMPLNKTPATSSTAVAAVSTRPLLTTAGSFHSSRRGSEDSVDDNPLPQSMTYRDMRVSLLYLN